MKALGLILFFTFNSCSHASFYNYKSGKIIFSKIKSCVDKYHSSKTKKDLKKNESELLKLRECIKPFVSVEERYLNRMAFGLTTIKFTSDTYECKKEVVKEVLRYKEKKPSVSVCVDINDGRKDRKAVIFFQEVKYKLKFTEIRH